MPAASAAENQSQIPQFSLYDLLIFSSAPLEPLLWETAWHWASRIRYGIPPSLRKYVYGKIHYEEDISFLTTFFHFLKQFGSFCKERKSLEIMEKMLIYCPILFSFFSF